jgi:sugar lactone lactonase YvrE
MLDSLTANHASSNDVFVFGGKHGVGVAQKNSGEYHYIQRWWTPEEEAQGKTAQFRANDGAVDSRGRLWAGTMNDPLTASIGRNDTLSHRPPPIHVGVVVS